MEQEYHAMKLFSHPMSSCSRRVRLALYLKGLKYECINITSVGDPELLKVNPMGYVPALVDGTTIVSDSYAILLYLEEKYPQHALLPQDIMKKAINYQAASIVSSSIQPLQNTTLVHYIGEIVGPDEKLPWAQRHIRKGFVGLKYECINVTPLKDPELSKINPMGYVPALVDGATVVSDSYAILLYLEEKYPQHALLPEDLMKKSINYQVASIVSSSIQPLQNTNIVNYIEEIVSPDEKITWAQRHIRKGFVALEKLLVNHAAKYATGDEIYLADLFLAPQIYNAIYLYNLDMAEFPTLLKLNKTYGEIPSFQQIMAES